MKLTRQSLDLIKSASTISIPSADIFELPEKVLQFGTGVLLRGLPDYYIDKANKQKIFNGRVVVVKSTSGSTNEFDLQDGLYTHCIKGIENEVLKENYVINASVSRVLSAAEQWQEVLDCAASTDIKIIISNTTEVGIVLLETDRVNATPPASFPGKLLACLYHRYKVFNGTPESGLVIVPTELLVNNGNKLQEIVVQLAKINQLEESFIQWLQQENDFCNSLVDRIVPGALSASAQDELEASFGYQDPLAIMSETYSLWAIETKREKTKELLSFYQADDTVIITESIEKFRELKLRLLNGTHTFSCGLAYLSGFELVNQAMQHEGMHSFISSLMLEEIVPCVVSESITQQEAKAFATSVINRFANPYIQHKWLSITLQYTGKMKMRNVPLLLKHYALKEEAPKYMAMGFAAYLLFMKTVGEEHGKYYGSRNGERYLIQDEHAAYFYKLWKDNKPGQVVQSVLSNVGLWDTDLHALPGFTEAVTNFILSNADGKTIIL